MKKITTLACLFFLSIGTAYATDTPVAKVGDRIITDTELQRILKSTPYGGDKAMGALPTMSHKEYSYILEGTINAELLYKKALESGINKEESLKKEVEGYRNSILASLYRNKLMDSIKLDDKDVAYFAVEKGLAEKEAESMAKAKRMKKLLGETREKLAKKQQVKFIDGIESKKIKDVKQSDILVSSKNFTIRLHDVAERVKFHAETDSILTVISPMFQLKLFTQAAKDDGLEKAPRFLANAQSFEKNLIISLYREKLQKDFQPSEKEIAEFLKHNSHLLEKPRVVSATMIVTKTEAEAKKLRAKALKGENFYELAKKNSIAPNAKQTVGVIGTMEIGTRPLTSLDLTLVSMKSGEITQPIKGDKGYSIFRLEQISKQVKREKSKLDEMVKRIFVEAKMRSYLGNLWKSEKVEVYVSNLKK